MQICTQTTSTYNISLKNHIYKIHVHVHIHVHICMYTYMYVCIHVCMYVCMYACMYVHVVHTHTHTYIHTHIHINWLWSKALPQNYKTTIYCFQALIHPFVGQNCRNKMSLSLSLSPSLKSSRPALKAHARWDCAQSLFAKTTTRSLPALLKDSKKLELDQLTWTESRTDCNFTLSILSLPALLKN